MLYILRKKTEECMYSLVGSCYVHVVMDGENAIQKEQRFALAWRSGSHRETIVGEMSHADIVPQRSHNQATKDVQRHAENPHIQTYGLNN